MSDVYIYTVGDFDFMKAVLNGVAMISSGGSEGSFNRMIAIGSTFGIFMAFFQSMMQGAQKIEIHSYFVGMILFGLAYGSTATVVLEDSVTEETAVVANVPYGIAQVGSIISTIGHTVTTKMQTAYGLASSMSSNGYGDTLSILTNMHKLGGDHYLTSLIDKGNGGGSVSTSLTNYAKSCLEAKFAIKGNASSFYKDNIWESLKFESGVYTATMVTKDGEEEKTCTDAYEYLKEAIVGNIDIDNEQLKEYVNSKVNLSAYDANEALSNVLVSVGGTASDINQFTQSVYLEPIISGAIADTSVSKQDVASTIMMVQAINQRNTQWAAEGSLFVRTMRPMMTFFEGFVYAITPIMAFVMMLGSKGISLAGKYFLTLLWIQLWQPVVAIINLYTGNVAQSRMSSFRHIDSTDAARIYESFDGTQQMMLIAQEWLGVAGMLTAATPAITLMLLYGSAVTATSLAGRMGRGDTLDEKIQSPDMLKTQGLVNAGASMSYQGGQQHTAGGGAHDVGATFQNYSLQSASQSGQAATSSVGRETTQMLSHSIGNTLSHNIGSQESLQRFQEFGKQFDTSNSQGSQAVRAATNEFMKSSGLSKDQKNTVQGVIGAGLSGAISTKEMSQALGAILENSNGSSQGGGGMPALADQPTSGVSTDASGAPSSPAGASQLLKDIELPDMSKLENDGAPRKNVLAHAAKALGAVGLEIGANGRIQDLSEESQSQNQTVGSSDKQNYGSSESIRQELKESTVAAAKDQHGFTQTEAWSNTDTNTYAAQASEVSKRTDTFNDSQQRSTSMAGGGTVSENQLAQSLTQRQSTPQGRAESNEFQSDFWSLAKNNPEMRDNYNNALMSYAARGVEDESQAKYMAMLNTLHNKDSFTHDGKVNEAGYSDGLAMVQSQINRYFGRDDGFDFDSNLNDNKATRPIENPIVEPENHRTVSERSDDMMDTALQLKPDNAPLVINSENASGVNTAHNTDVETFNAGSGALENNHFQDVGAQALDAYRGADSLDETFVGEVAGKVESAFDVAEWAKMGIDDAQGVGSGVLNAVGKGVDQIVDSYDGGAEEFMRLSPEERQGAINDYLKENFNVDSDSDGVFDRAASYMSDAIMTGIGFGQSIAGNTDENASYRDIGAAAVSGLNAAQETAARVTGEGIDNGIELTKAIAIGDEDKINELLGTDLKDNWQTLSDERMQQYQDAGLNERQAAYALSSNSIFDTDIAQLHDDKSEFSQNRTYNEMAVMYADDSGFHMGDEGRVVLNNPERQEAVEKMATQIEDGANLGDFSQDGHFSSIAMLNNSYDRGYNGSDEGAKERRSEGNTSPS
ncbi:conjugal transfer protein TraG N-terminal domain-containing protein [Marinomonas epiphytica]